MGNLSSEEGNKAWETLHKTVSNLSCYECREFGKKFMSYFHDLTTIKTKGSDAIYDRKNFDEMQKFMQEISYKKPEEISQQDFEKLIKKNSNCSVCEMLEKTKDLNTGSFTDASNSEHTQENKNNEVDFMAEKMVAAIVGGEVASELAGEFLIKNLDRGRETRPPFEKIGFYVDVIGGLGGLFAYKLFPKLKDEYKIGLAVLGASRLTRRTFQTLRETRILPAGGLGLGGAPEVRAEAFPVMAGETMAVRVD